MRIRAVVLAAAFAALVSCTPKKTIWVYTSLYKEVIAEIEPAIRAAVPEAEIRFFQGGSENVAAKLGSELAAGHAQADLVLTSDPFWYLELKKTGKLLSYDSPAAHAVPPELRDPDGAFVTVRVCAMVIGYNSQAVTEADAPKSWKELADPRWAGKVSMGSPLESGTTFTLAALLSRQAGWELFGKLRSQELIAAGGNGSVISRMETRERPVGIVLLENILKSARGGSPVRAVYPAEGVVPIPSPIAILKDSGNPELAKKVYDWFFSEAAQRAIVKGDMYSPVDGIPAPEGARPWKDVARIAPWNPKLLEELYAGRADVKRKFAEVVLR
jgi:iron(III) transport system substrate-binding protein